MGARNLRQRVLRAAAAAAVVAAAACAYLWLRPLWEPDAPPGFRMLPRERLTYAATSSLGDAGTVVVEVSPLLPRGHGSAAYRITCTVRPSRTVSALYVMKGQASVLVDATTLLPLEFEEKMVTGFGPTGGDRKHRKFVYDHAKRTLRYYKAKDGEGPLRLRHTRSIPPNTHHYLSLLSFVRKRSMQVGDQFSVLIADKRHPEDDLTVRISVVREEDYRTPGGGTRRALVLETKPKLRDPDVKATRLVIRLDAADRFPVRLDAETLLGRISGRATFTLTKRTLLGNTPSEPE